MHISAAMGSPTIGLLRSLVYFDHYPYHKNSWGLYHSPENLTSEIMQKPNFKWTREHDVSSMNKFTVEEILDKIKLNEEKLKLKC